MPIESTGKKDPALAARMKAGVLPADELSDFEYTVGRRPLKVGDETREPGDPIPEAAEWPRLESWIRSGAINKRPATAGTVTRPKQTTARPKKTTTATETPRRPVLRPLRGRAETA